MKARGVESHSIGIAACLLVLICSKLFVGRLPHVVCTILLFILYYRRIQNISGQLKVIARGEMEYPSLIDIVDSFMVPELATVFWGWYLFISYCIGHFGTFTLADCIILALMFSHLLFLMLVIVQQYFLSFFFTTAMGHGFFLFSILPRFVAGARTLLVSFIWWDAIRSFNFFSPLLLRIIYTIFKFIFILLWLFDLFQVLFSKDFPPEFGTVLDKKGFNCPVCMDTVQFYITLPCTHQFCLSCFCKWGHIHLNCPVCRTEFSSWIHQADFNNFIWFSLVVF